MTPLLILAASGLARETVEAVWAQGLYEPIGVLDDDPRRWGDVVAGVPVLGGLEIIDNHRDAQILLCAGSGTSRAALAARVDATDARYATVIHPSVCVPRSSKVGPGAILLAGTVITAEVMIGRHSVLMPNVTVTHDNALDDFVTLCSGVQLGGAVSIGQRAYLGMGSSVRQELRIGSGATIGMGAVVLADVPAGETWVGNPARRLRSANVTAGALR